VNCTACGNEIRQGERYVSYNRHVERLERKFFRTAITVEDAEELSTYHEKCAPKG
jgi:hypothetical protein